MIRMLFLLALILPVTTIAQIYKTTDAAGNVGYTDQAPKSDGSSPQVDLPPTNSSTSPQPPISRRDVPLDLAAEAKRAAAPAPIPAPITYSVEIVSPDTETTIPMGPGNFSLSARVDPIPEAGGMLQLSIDGSPWGEPQEATTWQLNNVFRGAHDLTVNLLDSSGSTVVSSTPIRVYVLRPSIRH